MGYLATISNHANQVIRTFTYDGNGNMLTEKDVDRNLTTSYAYDAMNRLVRHTDAAGKVTTFHHDEKGLQQVQDARLNKTVLNKNSRSQLKQLQSPDSGQSSLQHDIMGLMRNKTDARGITSTYDYDVAGRLIRKNSGSAPLKHGHMMKALLHKAN